MSNQSKLNKAELSLFKEIIYTISDYVATVGVYGYDKDIPRVLYHSFDSGLQSISSFLYDHRCAVSIDRDGNRDDDDRDDPPSLIQVHPLDEIIEFYRDLNDFDKIDLYDVIASFFHFLSYASSGNMTKREPFKPREGCFYSQNIFHAFAEAGYAKYRGDLFQWSPKIDPFIWMSGYFYKTPLQEPDAETKRFENHIENLYKSRPSYVDNLIKSIEDKTDKLALRWKIEGAFAYGKWKQNQSDKVGKQYMYLRDDVCDKMIDYIFDILNPEIAEARRKKEEKELKQWQEFWRKCKE